MESESNKPIELAKAKPISPWLLLQFLPAVILAIVILINHSLIDWQYSGGIICISVFTYSCVLSYLFYRSRGKYLAESLLFSFLKAMVFFAANVIVCLSIIFVGCSCGLHGR